MTELETVARRAIERGWTSTRGDIETMLAQALQLGWQAVPIRKGDTAVGTLRAVRAEDAHEHSLSALVGHGEQPLHTDGAHHRLVPDIVLLSAVESSATPTLLCDPGVSTEAQRAGIFKVGGGSRAFYASAVDTDGMWRYDPGCMTPMDEYAREVSREVATLAQNSVEHHWHVPQTVLVIANRRVLHARAAVRDPQTRRVHRVALVSRLES